MSPSYLRYTCRYCLRYHSHMRTEVAGNRGHVSLNHRHPCEVDSSSTSQAGWSVKTFAVFSLPAVLCPHLSEYCRRQYLRLLRRLFGGVWEPGFTVLKVTNFNMLHWKTNNCRCPNIMFNRLFSSKLLACYSKWFPCPRTNYSKNLKHPIIYSLICFVLRLSTKLVMASAPNISWISCSMGSQQGLNARNVHGKTSGSLTNDDGDGNGNGNENGKKRWG